MAGLNRKPTSGRFSVLFDGISVPETAHLNGKRCELRIRQPSCRERDHSFSRCNWMSHIAITDINKAAQAAADSEESRSTA
jgi:hypothetical protein